MKQTKKELRQFGITTGILIAAIFGLLIPWIWDTSYFHWPWYVGGVLATIGLILPGILQPVFTIWMKFAHVLGWINTRIILGFIFYVFFMPVSVLFRIIGKDPMHRKFDKDIKSYRNASLHSKTHNMEKPF